MGSHNNRVYGHTSNQTYGHGGYHQTPRTTGGYNQTHSGYNQTPGGYNPNYGGYSQTPRTSSHNQTHGGYSQTHGGGYNQTHGGGYNQTRSGYNQTHGGYNQTHGGYSQTHGGYNQTHGGYNQTHRGYDEAQAGHNQKSAGNTQGKQSRQPGYNKDPEVNRDELRESREKKLKSIESDLKVTQRAYEEAEEQLNFTRQRNQETENEKTSLKKLIEGYQNLILENEQKVGDTAVGNAQMATLCGMKEEKLKELQADITLKKQEKKDKETELNELQTARETTELEKLEHAQKTSDSNKDHQTSEIKDHDTSKHSSGVVSKKTGNKKNKSAEKTRVTEMGASSALPREQLSKEEIEQRRKITCVETRLREISAELELLQADYNLVKEEVDSHLQKNEQAKDARVLLDSLEKLKRAAQDALNDAQKETSDLTAVEEEVAAAKKKWEDKQKYWDYLEDHDTETHLDIMLLIQGHLKTEEVTELKSILVTAKVLKRADEEKYTRFTAVWQFFETKGVAHGGIDVGNYKNLRKWLNKIAMGSTASLIDEVTEKEDAILKKYEPDREKLEIPKKVITHLKRLEGYSRPLESKLEEQKYEVDGGECKFLQDVLLVIQCYLQKEDTDSSVTLRNFVVRMLDQTQVLSLSDSYAQEHQKSKDEIIRLKGELKTAISKTESIENEKKEAVSKLNSEKKTIRERLFGVSREKEEREEQIKMQKEEHKKRLESSAKNWEEERRNLEDEKTTMQGEIKTLERQIKELTTELANVRKEEQRIFHYNVGLRNDTITKLSVERKQMMDKHRNDFLVQQREQTAVLTQERKALVDLNDIEIQKYKNTIQELTDEGEQLKKNILDGKERYLQSSVENIKERMTLQTELLTAQLDSLFKECGISVA